MDITNIVCIGAGYVGGPTMSVIADKCSNVRVTVYDVSQSRIDAWNSPEPTSVRGKPQPCNLPIYEPGLSEIVYRIRGKRLFFTTDKNVLSDADVVFIAVNTPVKAFGEGSGSAADVTYVEQSARLVGEMCAKNNVIVVEKSTVPVRCGETINTILSSMQHVPNKKRTSFTVLSNPEFLAEGTAIDDLLNPNRVLIGGTDARSIASLAEIYANWVPKERIITTNIWSSELSKLVSNAFLAQRVSSINSITSVCECTCADIEQVHRVLRQDPRIGAHFMNPSIGFGGSCFRKDLLHLVYLCESYGLDMCAEYWMSVLKMNDYQMNRFCKIVVQTCFNTVNFKIITVYGFAFKKNTSDTRDSPAIHVCNRMLEEGSTLHIYDPKVTEENVYNSIKYHADINRSNIFSKSETHNACLSDDMMRDMLRDRVRVMSDPIRAAQGATAILILTDWDEFKTLDYSAVYECMQKPAFIFDGRIITDINQLRKIGFHAYCIGKPNC